MGIIVQTSADVLLGHTDINRIVVYALTFWFRRLPEIERFSIADRNMKSFLPDIFHLAQDPALRYAD